MKADIHPTYEAITATCSCGNVIQTRSTLGKPMSLDVCNECHPFYTGKQKVLDVGGRVSSSSSVLVCSVRPKRKRYGRFGSLMGCSALLKNASLVGAFFVSALMVLPAQAFCPLQPDLSEVRVRQVVDGDTLKLADGRSVRLIGLNTPELGRKGRSAEPGAQAAQRRQFQRIA